MKLPINLFYQDGGLDELKMVNLSYTVMYRGRILIIVGWNGMDTRLDWNEV